MTPTQPRTQAGKDMLNDMRTVWGIEAWKSYSWENDVAAIEEEAVSEYREALKNLFEEVTDGWGDAYTDTMRDVAVLLDRSGETE